MAERQRRIDIVRQQGNAALLPDVKIKLKAPGIAILDIGVCTQKLILMSPGTAT